MTGKHSSVQRRQTLKAYGFMTPALIIIILFTIIPIIGSLVLMFYDYSVLGQTKFVGLKNFVNRLKTGSLRGWKSIIRFHFVVL